MDSLDFLAVQGILQSLLQHHSLKTSILWCSAFFLVQLSYPYTTTGKTIALTKWTFVWLQPRHSSLCLQFCIAFSSSYCLLLFCLCHISFCLSFVRTVIGFGAHSSSKGWSPNFEILSLTTSAKISFPNKRLRSGHLLISFLGGQYSTHYSRVERNQQGTVKPSWAHLLGL